MNTIFRYDKKHETELISLLKAEPDWTSFTEEESIGEFQNALLGSETYICKSSGDVCGYLRAIVDSFGIYVSELYVALHHRQHGHGKALLRELKRAHPEQDVYVLSDEDPYYEKLGCKRVGSVLQL